MIFGQSAERSETIKVLLVLPAKLIELRGRLEASPQSVKRAHLELEDLIAIDQALGVQSASPLSNLIDLRNGFCICSIDPLNMQPERVEEASGGRVIGAGLLRNNGSCGAERVDEP